MNIEDNRFVTLKIPNKEAGTGRSDLFIKTEVQ